jgi:hypothetical protein
MVDRRRQPQNRSLSNVPATELDLLWQISERLATVEADLADHIDEHKADKKARASTRALVWTNTFVAARVIATLLTHFLPR